MTDNSLPAQEPLTAHCPREWCSAVPSSAGPGFACGVPGTPPQSLRQPHPDQGEAAAPHGQCAP